MGVGESGCLRVTLPLHDRYILFCCSWNTQQIYVPFPIPPGPFPGPSYASGTSLDSKLCCSMSWLVGCHAFSGDVLWYIYIYNICIYIQIYMVNPHQGLPWAFFCGICSRNKTYILLSSILCDSHTTTQVWYSLTLVFLQFHLVTPHPRTPRLPSLQSKVAFVEELGWIRVMLFKTCFTSFIGM